LVPKDQAYFITGEWQIDERDAQEDIRKGRATQTEDLQGLFREMDQGHEKMVGQEDTHEIRVSEIYPITCTKSGNTSTLREVGTHGIL